MDKKQQYKIDNKQKIIEVIWTTLPDNSFRTFSRPL